MGNPNVGKSVVFSKLTGVEVESANYAGTTVSYTRGELVSPYGNATLIDVPGTYSLEATSPAEEVAVQFMEQGADAVICVLDATNLERNLNLVLQLKEYDIPLVVALNQYDVAQQQGFTLDVEKLEALLGIPVIPTVAIRNVGLDKLIRKTFALIGTKRTPDTAMSSDQRWALIGKIIEDVQIIGDREPTFLERWGDRMLRPFPGLPIAILILAMSLGLVVGGGKALRGALLLPLVNNLIVPAINGVVGLVVPPGLFRNVLVGEYGVLVKMIEWPFALILPYVFFFYVVFSFLEDSGYLPRLGVLMDGMMQKIGIQGGNIIPLILGYGCAVPAILGTRAALSQKERVMVASLISFAVPCAAQSGAFMSLLGERSIFLLAAVYLISFLAIVVVGMILDRLIPGKTAPLLLEVPNLLMPDRDTFLKKLRLRLKHFLKEAQIPMFVGILLAALIAETGFLEVFALATEPLVQGWLGLPGEASMALLLGIVRRELTVLPLLEMNLSSFQLLVGSVVALFYLPCLAVFMVLFKEFKLRIALAISLGTVFMAFFIAGVINQTGRLFLGFF